MNFHNSHSNFDMDDEEIDRIHEVMDEHIHMVWEKEGRPDLDDCDKWEDFIELAFNTENEYQAEMEDAIAGALSFFNPFSMLGLVNYINDYYTHTYGYNQAIIEWKAYDRGNIYAHTGYAFAKKEYTREDMSRIIEKYKEEPESEDA